MKTQKITRLISLIFIAVFLHLTSQVQAQSSIEFTGLLTENEGSASWDADGSGPEPYGNGHGTFLYYVASRDYVDESCDYGAHVTSIGSDFPAFAQALDAHGFVPGQVKIRLGLASQGDDQMGSDWFAFGLENYLNFYPVEMKIYLDDELLITGLANYMVFHSGPSTGGVWEIESNYFLPFNASGFSPEAVQEVAAAFMQDVGTDELKFITNTFGETQGFFGNGRNGSYFNVDCAIEKGHPELPFQGLAADHEGFAGWDADGTGPEPKRNGHDNQLYFAASRDYDSIDPDPDACFAHLLDDGFEGFQNLALQLTYRGFTFDQIKIKVGLRDLDEDIEGEDWSFIYPIHTVNFYHSLITAEINGELLFGFVCDTAMTWQDVAHPALGWWGTSALTPVFDASSGSSPDVQAVAASFLKDMDGKLIQTNTIKSTSASGIINSNGRTGGFWQIDEAKLTAWPPKGTQVQPGVVSGHWTMAGHPYTVTGDITIPDGQTLVIDPGVWVKFSDRVLFMVDGSLQAIGDSSNTGSIVFTAVDPELGWGHIIFDSTQASNPASEFRNCIFEYGYAPAPVPLSSPYNCGGAIGIREYSNVVIENCLFRYNQALHDGVYRASGGAIALWTSSPVIRNCVFSNNSANWSGAIACVYESSPEIVNCLFYGNQSLRQSSDGGGAILSFDSNPVLINNTFVNNHSNFRGGAMEIYDGSEPLLVNNIFWGNTAPQNSQIFISSGDCNVDFKYNDIEGGLADIGPYGIGSGVFENNLETDPFFKDLLALNYQLEEGSPCIDAGTPDVTGLDLPPYDLLGNVRIWNGGVYGEIIDMGAYEFGAPLYTGVGQLDSRIVGRLQIKVNPNPTQRIVDFRYSIFDFRWVSLKIYDIHGREVAVLVDGSMSGDQVVRWDATGLPAGIYFARVQAGNDQMTIKLIKAE